MFHDSGRVLKEFKDICCLTEEQTPFQSIKCEVSQSVLQEVNETLKNHRRRLRQKKGIN